MSLVWVVEAVGKVVVGVCTAAQRAEQNVAGGAAWLANCLFWQLSRMPLPRSLVAQERWTPRARSRVVPPLVPTAAA